MSLRKIWWISLFFKLALGTLLPLSADETYYWVWSKNLQLSYFDHPGMIAWVLNLGNLFEGLASAVRIPGIILGHLTVLVWIVFLKRYMDIHHIRYWLALALFSPLIGFGSLIMTPDLPVVFFWSLSMFLFVKLLEKPEIGNSILFGLSLGLGFCSKYHIVLFLPIALFYLTVEKKWRLINLNSVLVVFLFGLIGSLPVLVWNYANDFSSFRFQLNHGLGRGSWNPFWSYSYPIGQILLIFPIPFWLALRSWKTSSLRIFHYFAWGPLVFFQLSSFRGVVEMNWPIIAYPSVYALAAAQVNSLRPLKATLMFWISISALVISHILIPWIPGAPDKLNEARYFQPLLPSLKKYQPLYAESYQMASYLWYSSKTPVYKLFQMSRRDFFDELPQAKPRENIFYIAMDRNAGLPEWLVEKDPYVELVEELSDRFVVNKVRLRQ